MNMPMTRRIVLCALLAFAGLGAALAADLVLVEDWSKIPVGTTGIPPGNPILFRCETPAKLRFDSEDIEKISAH